MSARKTKIVATIGPASSSEDMIRKLMESGMDVARMNCSHGTRKSHISTLNMIKKVRSELGLPVAVLLDTRGPEIRLRSFLNGEVYLESGQTFTLTSRDVEGDNTVAGITYPGLVRDVKAGGRILIDDGLIEMEIIDVTETDIVCRVNNSGVISDSKGVNVPDCDLNMPYISRKDYEDIVFAAENDFEFIAASFTRTGDDIAAVREVLRNHNCSDMSIIAKIENIQGVNNIDEIIEEADGIMIARGDMGVEIPLEDVPVIQKMIICKARKAGKPVITATQMLDSMIRNPRPTRAEAADVANAVFDGSSAVMLSGETAAGKYPEQAVQTMALIAQSAEAAVNYGRYFREHTADGVTDVTNAVTHAACETALRVRASAIICVTTSGFTGRMVSGCRPGTPVVACTVSEKIWRSMNLLWGIIPCLIPLENDTDTLFRHAVEAAEKTGAVKHGDTVVIVAGVPLGIPGRTNMIRVYAVE